MIGDYDFHAVTTWLDECRRPLIFAHERADGDSLGAMAAMTLALRARGAEPEAALFEELPRQYSLFDSVVNWRQWDDVRGVLCDECDAVIVLDTCALAQLEPIAEFLQAAPRTLVIDHHATRDPIATRPGDLRLFDETASAASLIVAEWIQSTGAPLSEPLATALFVGIATDCGWFRFSNTDARTMRMAAELVQAGADPNRVHAALYQQDPPEKLRLVARVLGNLELKAGGRLAVMTLREPDFEATGADRGMASDLVNEVGRLGCVEATLMFTEEPGAVVRVNFRSKSTLDVAEIARRYGGGGHVRAAGARLRGKWDDVVPRVIAEVSEAL